MTDEELAQQIADRKIVTVGAAAKASGKSRAEVTDFIERRGLKIFDEVLGIWHNEDAKGHC